ncbi:DUF2973 domain-containing protein [Kovacikia minuta CCNUW1]|uniref:DUF2973 domain-containing protein n=1 Tax=Kovacikia minuta TaxID=2931930 RepID=UPI001CCB9403|nr:DUF2973 domain-containing protein [Kovacikia minuta]UBF26427.1 DUF2973 domain-containing protein [Kovacikia minuta CCNUW1]
MLHLLYILAFTILAVLAVGNLIRNIMTLGMESQRPPAKGWRSGGSQSVLSRQNLAPHPELLDGSGNMIDEPLLVMRSMSVEDAREQLDAIYDSSPGSPSEPREEI